MAFAGMKLELGDRDRLLMHRFTLAVSELTQEIKRYNDANEVVDADVVDEGDPAEEGIGYAEAQMVGVDGK